MKFLVHTLDNFWTIIWVNYCNLLSGLPLSYLGPIISMHSCEEQIIHLYWLSVPYQIQNKLHDLAFKVLHGLVSLVSLPSYPIPSLPTIVNLSSLPHTIIRRSPAPLRECPFSLAACYA